MGRILQSNKDGLNLNVDLSPEAKMAEMKKDMKVSKLIDQMKN